MAGHGEKLSRKQEALIGALLSAPTIGQAATLAGVGEVTAYRWLHDPAFHAAYQAAKRQVVQQAITQVQQATGTAVTTLRQIMENPEAPASSRVSAAKTVLDLALRGVELDDLAARIAALEAVITQQGA